MDFTYGIVTYNSEQTIIETLESIRYQVIKYGYSYDNFLIISDDCSTDGTLFLVDKWLSSYSNIFVDIKILKTEKNSGLCVNYALMVDNIQSSQFIQLAGDDLICSENIYTKIFNIPQNELRVYLKLSFAGSSVCNIPEDYMQQLFYSKYKHTNKKDIWIIESLSPYSSVEINFQKEHYSSQCMEYIKNFRNFEDDTSLYYILKHNKEAYYNFNMSPLVLYRREENSLTKIVNTSSQIAFLDDLYVFRKHTFKNEKNIIIKIFLALLVWDNFLMKHRFSASNCLDRKIKRKIYHNINDKVIKDNKYGYCIENYNSLVKRESIYLNEIQKSAHDFIEGMKGN